MSNKYSHLSYNEIREMIRELNSELEHRANKFRAKGLPSVVYERLLMAGYTDDVISTPEKLNEALIKLLPLLEAEEIPYEPKRRRVIRPKYVNPKTNEAWAGRGAFAPSWVQKIMNERKWSLEEFKNSEEFKIKSDGAE
jgi:hypothetical protein